MPNPTTLICLANSRKSPGRCVAGLIADDTTTWVRPIGDRAGHSVSLAEQRDAHGDDIEVLDLVSIPLAGHDPAGHQTENHRFDSTPQWERLGRIEWDDLLDLESAPRELWNDVCDSTIPGTRDRVTPEFAAGLDHSLRLILVSDLRLRVCAPGAAFGNQRRRVYADFTYLGTDYGLSVTDPMIETEYLGQQMGTYPIGDAFLTVSLGEEYVDGYCYKMIAAIIDRDRAG